MIKVPVVNIDSEELLDEVLGISRDVDPTGQVELELSVNDEASVRKWERCR